jgi:hypothetical protein
MVTIAGQQSRIWRQSPIGLVPIDRFQLRQRAHQTIDAFLVACGDDVEIERRYRRAVQNCRNPADDDEVDAMAPSSTTLSTNP